MRFEPDVNLGLTQEQVKKRTEQDFINKDESIKTKSVSNIIRTNFLTLFNILNLSLGILVLMVGEIKNLLFLGIVFCNVIISIFQEVRTKLIIDKLTLLATNKTTVLRDGIEVQIDNDKIVLDDIIVLKNGNQIVCDGYIKKGQVTVDESYITGESEPINYKQGDFLKSGSFILNGSCKIKVEHIKTENYINKISKDAKYIKKSNSILLKTVKKIIKIISFFIIPIGILLFLNQYALNNDIKTAVLGTVAAMIGMIPEGLVLLTSTVLALSVIKLSKYNVLVQDLYCIEMLARVDTICFDKTGTLTDGKMKLQKTVILDKTINIENIMGNYIEAVGIENNTIQALSLKYKKYLKQKITNIIPFNSNKKYSSVTINNKVYKLGAPDILAPSLEEIIKIENRVILLTENEKPIAYFIIADNIKKSAKKMIEYFQNQNVNVLIISGDNLNTVSNVAENTNIKVKAVDLSKIKLTDKVVLNNNVFARVNPMQKKEIITILQKNNHFVAMTGDGVNDILALKQSDCAITIKKGTDMAKSISQLILLDSEYDSIPHIIKEGRKTVNNMERSSTLFLSKNIAMIILAMIFILFNLTFPFEPIHLSLTNMFVIGIPSFVLALEGNYGLIKNNLLINIFNKAIPTALIFIFNIILMAVVGRFFNLDSLQTSTLSVYMFAFSGFMLLVKLCIPLTKKKMLFLISLIGLFFLTTIILKDFYELTQLTLDMIIILIISAITSALIYTSLLNIFKTIIKEKSQNKKNNI